MIKRILIVLLLLAPFAVGQSTTVSATVVDSSSQAWANGTYTISFRPVPNQPGPYLWNGSPLITTQFTGTMNGSGVFSVSIPSSNAITPAGSQWTFTICPSATSPCGTMFLPITGSSEDVSAQITAAIPSVHAFPTPMGYAYADSQVQQLPGLGQSYFNTTQKVPKYWDGSAWQTYGSGNGTIQPTPQFRLFIQPNAGTQTVAGPASTAQNAVTPLLQGIGNTDLFATGAGNNGTTNFFSTYPTGLANVPPGSTDTESPDTTVGSGASLLDLRSNGRIVTTKDVGQSHSCSPQSSGPITDTVCERDTATLPRSQIHNNGYFIAAGPGFNLGNDVTSAQGWSLTTFSQDEFDALSRGIKSIDTHFFNCHSIGDCNGPRTYETTDGGQTEASGEGNTGGYASALENSSYIHATISSGGSTGSNNLNTTLVSGQNVFTDGGYLLDISKGTLSGTITDMSFPTVLSSGTPFMAWDMSGITMPVSTAWGVSNSATTSAANGKFQVPVSQTINFTLGTLPSASGPFVVGNNACMVKEFAEQVSITAVGTPSAGVQSVTFSTRYGYSAGALLMQGGVCGQYPTKTGATWRTAIMAIGSLTSGQVILAACSHGNCTSSAPSSGSADIVTQVIGGNGTAISFYPGAEIIGTNKGTVNTVQLANNTAAWANGDSIEGPHPPAVNMYGFHIIAGQTTPSNDSFSQGLEVGLTGSALMDSYLQLDGGSKVTHIIKYLPDGSPAYNDFIYAVTNPTQAIIEYTNAPDSDLRVFEGSSASANKFYSLAGGGFRVLTGAAYAKFDALNIPATPTVLGQIPIATSLSTANINYQPVTMSGDATLAVAGAITVTKSNGKLICVADGTNCPAGIANVQVALPTTAIAANTCTAAATVTMTGVTTTSTFTTAFATDPSAVTGYGSSGGLTIALWPTVNTLNWRVCNSTASSITPGAMTINVGAK